MRDWLDRHRSEKDPISTASMDAAVSALTTTIDRSEVRYDPRPDLKRIAIPLLDLHGEFDLYVPTDINVRGVRGRLPGRPTRTPP